MANPQVLERVCLILDGIAEFGTELWPGGADHADEACIISEVWKTAAPAFMARLLVSEGGN